MSNPWADKVIGGIGVPKFLLCGENLCSNPYMDNGSQGYVQMGSNGVVDIRESENAYSQYIMQYHDNSISSVNDYIKYTVNYGDLTGQTINGIMLMASLRIKTDTDAIIKITNGTADYAEITVLANTNFEKVYLNTDIISSTSNFIYLYIIPDNQPNGFNILFDNVHFHTVNNKISYDQPNESSMIFKENLTGKNELWSGKIQKFNKKYIPEWSSDYKYISVQSEYYRQLIYQSSIIFMVPHDDINWGFFGIADQDFERKYSFNRFFGHSGFIKIMSQEFIYLIPNNVVSLLDGGSIIPLTGYGTNYGTNYGNNL